MQVVWKQRGVMVEAGALAATLEMLGCARRPTLQPDGAVLTEPREHLSESGTSDES